MKKGKQWLILFFAVVAVGTAAFMMVNYMIDPTGYFSVERKAGEVDANGYTRAAKSKYIKKHKDEYNAVVLGGSKSGVLSTELLSEYTGKNYYNFYFAYGCFSDFLTYSRYLIETADIDEITLHLSSIEVQQYDRSATNEIYEVPAVVDGNAIDLVLENLNYLCRNINSTVSYAMEGKENLEKGMDNLSTGERNYSYPYSLMEEDADAYVQKYVLPRYTKSLKKLFADKDPSAPAINDNITAMKQIKELCDANDVTLKVVIGPTFLAEMYKFEGQEYYNYLRELVQITDIWDFSGFLLENRNPYNFVNEGHYKNVVADLMVNIMYGKTERDGFGILLTKDNIEDYLAKRQADCEELKQEYEATGNVALETANNASYISSAM